MQIGIPAETRAGETRVAATAETARKLVTAKRLGAVIEASDVRPAVKEPKTAAGARK